MGLSSSLPEDSNQAADSDRRRQTTFYSASAVEGSEGAEECECYDVDEEPECLETKDLMSEYAIDEAVLKGFTDSVRSIVESRDKIENLGDELSAIERADASATATSNKLKAANYKRDGEGMFIMDGDQCLTMFTDGAVAFSKCSLSRNQLFEMKNGEVRKNEKCLSHDGQLSSSDCASFQLGMDKKLRMADGKALRAGTVDRSRRTVELFEDDGNLCPDGYVSKQVVFEKNKTKHGIIVGENEARTMASTVDIAKKNMRFARQTHDKHRLYKSMLKDGRTARYGRGFPMRCSDGLFNVTMHGSVDMCSILSYPYEAPEDYEKKYKYEWKENPDKKRQLSSTGKQNGMWNVLKEARDSYSSGGNTNYRPIRFQDPLGKGDDHSGAPAIEVPHTMCERPMTRLVNVSSESNEGNSVQFAALSPESAGRDFCGKIGRRARNYTEEEKEEFTSSNWYTHTLESKVLERESKDPCTIAKNIDDKFDHPCLERNDGKMYCYQNNADMMRENTAPPPPKISLPDVTIW